MPDDPLTRETIHARYRAACLNADMAYHRQLAALWEAYRQRMTDAADAYQDGLKTLWQREEGAPHGA